MERRHRRKTTKVGRSCILILEIKTVPQYFVKSCNDGLFPLWPCASFGRFCFCVCVVCLPRARAARQTARSSHRGGESRSTRYLQGRPEEEEDEPGGTRGDIVTRGFSWSSPPSVRAEPNGDCPVSRVCFRFLFEAVRFPF